MKKAILSTALMIGFLVPYAAFACEGPQCQPCPPGPQGIQGIPGKSITGPQGIQGVPGQSIVGPAGADGQSIVGPTGPQGESITGPAGPQGEPAKIPELTLKEGFLQGAAIAAASQREAKMKADIEAQNQRLNDLKDSNDSLTGGVAGAAAIASIDHARPGQSMVGMGLGYYENDMANGQAIAIGASHSWEIDGSAIKEVTVQLNTFFATGNGEKSGGVGTSLNFHF